MIDLSAIEALTVDTGGTVLDWHTGFREAFREAGRRHGIERDWGRLTNDLRRRSMAAMIGLGKDGPPTYNFDDAHRFCLDAFLGDEGLDAFGEADRQAIAWDAPHSFAAWPDVREGLASLRRRYVAVSFTLLSYRLVIDSSRRNGLSWDAVLSCEGFGVYKLLPEAYRRAASMLRLDPSACLMVACHPFDLDAARSVEFRTALVRRPLEWGARPADHPALPPPNTYDIEVESFTELAEALGRADRQPRCA